MVESRTCPRCKINKLAAEFYASKSTGHGLTSYCRCCIKAETAKRQAGMTPLQRVAAQDRRQEQINLRRANDPVFAAALRLKESRWREKHGTAPIKNRFPEEHAAYMREWRTGNKEAARRISCEANRRYRISDPDRVRISSAISNANRRAHKLGLPGRLAYEDWLLILVKMHGRCAFCLAEGCILDLEHVDPLSKGGTNDRSNITSSCRPCNGQKHSRSLAEFCDLRSLNETAVRERIAHGLAP